MTRSRSLPLLVALAAFACTLPSGPQPVPAPAPGEVQSVVALMTSAPVQRAFEHVDASRDQILAEWRMLTEINAPSGHEGERAAAVERILRRSPSLEVSRDEVGNLIAVRRGRGEGPTVYIDSHLDTVFQPGLVIETRVENGRLYGPGVGDDTRNIEAQLAMIRALDAAGVRTMGDLVFTFTVEEETSFRGIDHLLASRGSEIDHFIALDGGYDGFTYGGIGTNWYKHHFIGPGGHTRSRTPPYSAARSAARAIAKIYELRVPRNPPSHLNVGMMGGSDVINAKAEDAWFTVDLRSTDNEVMARLEKQIEEILREEARMSGLTWTTEVISKAPAAQIPGHRASPLVLRTEAVYRAMGFTNPWITPTASNHSSAALRKGISSVSTGTAPCGDAHAPTEWCEIEPFYRGIRKLILMGLAMTGVEQ